MVKIRLKRMGRKFNAFYRIVAARAESPRDGKFIEEIGYYNPQSKEVKVNQDLRKKWLDYGAVPSDTVKTLFKRYDDLKGQGDVVKLVVNKKVSKKSQPVILEKNEN